MPAKALRENINFIWLAGGQRPDFRTLNEFRGKLLKGVMEEIFAAAVKMLEAAGHIRMENYFVDGTKIESASGRYTFVWKKAVQKHDKKLDAKLRSYIWDHENEDYGDRDLEELGGKEQFTSADVKRIAAALKERLERLEGSGDEESKKKLKEARKAVESET